MSPIAQLAAAVKANDLGKARETLAHHPELKSRLNEPMREFCFGSTLLLGAVQQRSNEMIDLLLQAGADINARSHWWAGGFGVLDDDRGLAPFLIERGATVDAHAAARLNRLPQ